MSQERVNPFDKNKPAAAATTTTFTPPSYTPAVAPTTEKTLDDRFSQPSSQIIFKPEVSNVAGFDYSYKPIVPIASVPASVYATSVVDKAEETKPKSRPEFERKLSDADIVFGEIKKASAAAAAATQSYARNRSNSSFTSTSTDSDYIYGTRNSRRENSFQKSLSVSSDKDGDFSHDPTILSTRSGVCNDAFSDFDSPNKPSAKKSWSNIDDEYDLK
jgi:hypothetical protein